MKGTSRAFEVPTKPPIPAHNRAEQDAVIMLSLCTECECLYSSDSLAVPMDDALKELNVFEEEAQTDPV